MGRKPLPPHLKKQRVVSYMAGGGGGGMSFAEIVIYDPQVLPRIRCAVDKRCLGPGDVSQLVNARTDTHLLVSRIADSTLNASPPTGAKVTGGVYFPMGDWMGFLNGTAYWLSAWQMTAGGVAVFSQDLTTGTYTEITNAGAASPNVPTWGGDTNGNTRFSTQSGNVTYCARSTPRRVFAGTAVPPLDVLVIQNGEDRPIVYNPGSGLSAAAQVMWNNTITVPTGANAMRALATWSAYLQCATASGRTYAAAAGVINLPTHFSFSDSVATYTGTNVVLRLGLGTSTVSGDIATVRFTATAVQSMQGKFINLVLEGTAANILFTLKDTAIALGVEDVAYASVTTWNTIYDPTSSDASINKLPALTNLDSGNNRWVLSFPLNSIAALANRTTRHFRFTRTASPTVGTAITIYVLAAGSCGAGSGYPYGTEWSAVYADRYAFSESAPYPQVATDMDYLASIGGPRGPDANLTTPIVLARDTTLYYDYHLLVKNSDFGSGANFAGGLNGQASHIDFYFRNPLTEITPYYLGSYELWAPTTSGSNHEWANVAGSLSTLTLKSEIANIAGAFGFGYGSFTIIDYFQRDPGVPTPSDFSQAMPVGAVTAGANGRYFVGNTKTSSLYSRGELKFSDLGFLGRFRSISDVNDASSGGRLMMDGETIKAIFTLAAAAQGASTIYVLTDQSCNALASAGGTTFSGSGFSGVDLEQRWRISDDGTNYPFSVVQQNAVACWVNNQGHIVRFDGGEPINISLGSVTNSQGTTTGGVLDVIADIPATRRENVVSVAARGRFYFFMTPTGATVNSRCVIWNEVDKRWESIDTLTNGQRVTRGYDSAVAGAGQKVLLHGSNGVSYIYEAGSGTVAFRLITRGFRAEEVTDSGRGASYSVKEVELACDASTGETLTVDYYKNMGSVASQWLFLLDEQSSDEWLVQNRVVAGSTASGWIGYFDVQATITGGKKITHLMAYADGKKGDARGAT